MMLARPRGQEGFGLLETLAGLLVFVVIALLGTKAYHGLVSNQKEANEVKALTDAVSVTSERLSSLTVAALTQAGSRYLQWGPPEPIGSGEYSFRFRTVPRPSVNGAQDTTVVGLEVEIGPADREGGFTAARRFATLIAPHVSSKDELGQVSTADERSAEAAFYAAHRAEGAALAARVAGENQVRLNSFSCYDQGQCCDFMRKYFLDPTLKPQDGVEEKCFYRCALSGAVSVQSWNDACRTDFCAIAPWKTKEQCCAAIAAGECKPGSVCSNVCLGCVGEDGSTCAPPKCKDRWFNDLFDCKTGTMCDGVTPIPSSDIPGWGNVQELCKQSDCMSQASDCGWRQWNCCLDYWGKLNRSETPDPRLEICRTINPESQCCNYNLQINDWNIYCADGRAQSAQYKPTGKWYCQWGAGWDKVCAFTKGCSVTYRPSGAVGGGGDAQLCPAWEITLNDPWSNPHPEPPKPKPPVTQPAAADTVKPAKQPGKLQIVFPIRIPSNRGGNVFGSGGGNE